MFIVHELPMATAKEYSVMRKNESKWLDEVEAAANTAVATDAAAGTTMWLENFDKILLSGLQSLIDNGATSTYRVMLQIDVRSTDIFLETPLGKFWMLQQLMKNQFKGTEHTQTMQTITMLRKELNAMSAVVRKDIL